MKQVDSRLDSAAGKVGGLGKLMDTAFVGAMAAAGAKFVSMSVQFDKAMTNTGAVLGKTRQQLTGLRADLLSFGSDTIAGPQKVADAYYDVVGGVQDAS